MRNKSCALLNTGALKGVRFRRRALKKACAQERVRFKKSLRGLDWLTKIDLSQSEKHSLWTGPKCDWYICSTDKFLGARITSFFPFLRRRTNKKFHSFLLKNLIFVQKLYVQLYFWIFCAKNHTILVLHTIRKVKFLSKNSILTKPQHFHEFFTQFFLTIFLVKSKLSTTKKCKSPTFSQVFHQFFFFDNFSREIKVVNS